jgi:hypothetical protein
MNKKRTSTKKKPKKEAKTVNVNDLIQEADTAMEAMDLDRAHALYTAASTCLQGQIGEPPKMLLSHVLGKLGEVKVSFGDHEGARNDFSTAISLLENEDTVVIHETRANLYLYLGQVNSGLDALAAYRTGVEELEACIRLREKRCEQNDTMEEESSEQDALQETRSVGTVSLFLEMKN